jgi:haloalkane dehalogenase
MDVVRTPDDRFAGLADWPWAPRYVEVDGLRVHWVTDGPPDADPVLLLHGEPSWGYLYRTMIPVLTAAGHRVVGPDLVGFGRSDKPVDRAAYTYAAHLRWLTGTVEALDLRRVTLVCQDWGGLLGLRLVAEQPERFARVVAANTGLPVGDRPLGELWQRFRQVMETAPDVRISRIVAAGCRRPLSPAAAAAYDAPFPDDDAKAGARTFPGLVPQTPDDPEAAPNRRAWAVLAELDLPFLTAFSDADPITAGGERPFQERLRGAWGRDHVTIAGAGHFLQEDAGPELAAAVVAFCQRT